MRLRTSSKRAGDVESVGGEGGGSEEAERSGEEGISGREGAPMVLGRLINYA